jgi:DNA-directed RNA polymerase specialized sigma subunit
MDIFSEKQRHTYKIYRQRTARSPRSAAIRRPFGRRKKEYVYHINQTLFEHNVVTDSKAEGLAKGLAKGEKERRKLQQALEEKRIKREQLQREIETLKRRFDKK